MRTTKLADQYTESDLSRYFVGRATELTLIDKYASTTPLIRAYKNLLRGFDNNRYLLVMVTDYLLQGTYTSQVGATERLLTIPVFDVALRQMGGSRQPWKFLYLKRFAETEKEHTFFEYYLGLLEDAQAALPGDMPPSDLTWEGHTDLAFTQLEKAARILKKRCEKRWGLDEVFFIPPPPESIFPILSSEQPTIMRGKDATDS